MQVLLFIAFKNCGFLSGVIPQNLPDGRREKLVCNYMCVITAYPHFEVTQAKLCENRHAKKQMIVAKDEFSEISVKRSKAAVQ